MQVDPIKPLLKAPGTKRLKVKYGKLLSNFAFKFNLRRFIMAVARFNLYVQSLMLLAGTYNHPLFSSI